MENRRTAGVALVSRPSASEGTRRQLTVAFACLVGFAVLAALMWHARLPNAVDRGAATAVDIDPGGYRFRLGEVVSFVGSPGVVLVLGFLVAGWLTLRRHIAVALTVLAAPALAGIGEVVAKKLVERPRPLTAGLTGEGGFGFPSGHVAGLTALVLVCFLVAAVGRFAGGPRVVLATRVALLAVPAVAFARVQVGAHYLTDVLAGFLLGSAIAVLLVAVLPLTDRIVHAARLERGGPRHRG
jgi:undecaprenyl-diphosphatase